MGAVMLNFLLNNIPSIVSIFLSLITAYTGYRLSKLKEESDRRKTTYDAADGFRDDLMKQLEEAHKRIDAKDGQVDSLKDRVLTLEDENRSLKWELKIKTIEIEQQNKRIEDLQKTILSIQAQIGAKL